MSKITEILAIWLILSVVAFDVIILTKNIISSDKKSIIKTIAIIEIVTLLSSIIACTAI